MQSNPVRDYFPRIIQAASALEAEDILAGIGVDPHGIRAMLPKMSHVLIRIDGVSCRVANIIKQEMLSCGGDAAVHREAVACARPSTDVLIMGTRKQVLTLAGKLDAQPFGLAAFAGRLRDTLTNDGLEVHTLRTAQRQLMVGGRTRVMGILNVTPDSFSDGGRYAEAEDAVRCGCGMDEAGADFIDVGGESSRPGAQPVSLGVELDRVIPVIRELNGRVRCPISVDTTKAEVARQALAAGAEIVNDISAMTADPAMAAVVADSGAAVVLMHMRGTPCTMQEELRPYRHLPGDVIDHLRERIAAATAAGIESDRIIVDPGFGFGKSVADNLRLLARLSDFRVLGRPVLVGISRKSFVRLISGDALDCSGEGTTAAVAAATMNGAAIVRVHDVRAALKATAVIDALKEP
jgi:dihydropteroate synthase